MNGKGHLTIRAKKDKKWVLSDVEDLARKNNRSINNYVMGLLEKHVKKTKK